MSVPTFDVQTTRDGDVVVISPAGELDIATAPQLEQAIAEATAGGADTLVLDMRGVTFMDSTGLRTLVQTHQRSETEGFGLSIWRGPSQIDRLLSVSGLESILPLTDAP